MYKAKRLKSLVKDTEGYIGNPNTPFTPTLLGIHILNQEYRLKNGNPQSKTIDPNPLTLKVIVIIE